MRPPCRCARVPRARPAGPQSPRRATFAPRAHASPVMRPLPSGCTSSSSSPPSLVPTTAPSSTPGAGPSATTLARQTISRLPPGGRPRPPQTDAPCELDRRTGELEDEVVGFDLGRVRRLALLRHGIAEAAANPSTRRRAPRSASRCVSSAADSSSPIGVFDAFVHGPGVQPLVEAHQAHTRLRVTGENRPLHRRGTTPARQQREVRVHHRHDVEHVRLDELAESDDHSQLDSASSTSSTRSVTASPWPIAADLTGVGTRSLPRPRRRSGCVTTTAMSWPAATSASSVGLRPAASPETRGATEPSSSDGVALAQGAQRGLAGVGVEMLEQQRAVQMVEFVLEQARQQFVGLDRHLVAVEIETGECTSFGRTIGKYSPGPRGSPRRRPTRRVPRRSSGSRSSSGRRRRRGRTRRGASARRPAAPPDRARARRTWCRPSRRRAS